MAKKRKATKAVSRARSARAVSVRTKRSSSSSSGVTPMKAVLGGFIYGAARAKVAELVSPVTSKIPLGQYADEAVMGTINYFIAKGKVPFIPKHIGLAGLAVEAALLGQDAANGAMAGGFGTSTSKTSSSVQSY